jgi:hypothetical protein
MCDESGQTICAAVWLAPKAGSKAVVIIKI